MTIGNRIEALRDKLTLNQHDFGLKFNTSAMAISRWERDVCEPSSRQLIALGIAAHSVGLDAWGFWNAAGITKVDVRRILS